MAGNQRVGGIRQIQVNGQTYIAKGPWDYNLGVPKRTEVVNADGTVNYKEEPQAPFMEGEFTDDGSIDVKQLCETKDATVSIDLHTGKSIVMTNACFAGDGTVNTEEGAIKARFVGAKPEEIT